MKFTITAPAEPAATIAAQNDGNRNFRDPICERIGIRQMAVRAANLKPEPRLVVTDRKFPKVVPSKVAQIFMIQNSMSILAVLLMVVAAGGREEEISELEIEARPAGAPIVTVVANTGDCILFPAELLFASAGSGKVVLFTNGRLTIAEDSSVEGEIFRNIRLL